MRGTLSPAQRQTAVQENSGCGRAAPCSPASGPPCPCPAGSSPPRIAPCSGFGPPSLQSSGRASSSCCVLSTGPRRGAWPGMTRVVVWTNPGHLRPSRLLCPSSAWLEGTELADHWLQTDSKALTIPARKQRVGADICADLAHCCGCCGTSSCAGDFLCCACSSLSADFGFAM